MKQILSVSFLFIFFTSIIIPISQIEMEKSTKMIRVLNSNSIFEKNLKTSDVAGSELYAEQISAFVIGDKSYIRQSYLTNDSNILRGIDFNDPGFFDCSFMFGASNGIVPEIDPTPVGHSVFSADNLFIYESFFGFLYYNDTTATNLTLYEKSNRAKEVLRYALDIQIIDLDNNGIENFFPFIGYYPNMSNMMDVLTENVPKDGYFGALDLNRLKSKSYLENKHLSNLVLMFESMDLLFEGLNLTQNYFNFNIRNFGLSFLGSQDNGVSTADAVYSASNDIFSMLLGQNMNQIMGTGDSAGFNDILGLLGGGTGNLVSENEKMSIGFVLYEGLDDGIEDNGDNNYHFDLFKALNYSVIKNGPLQPSEKIFLAYIGALISEIDISVFSAEVKSYTPKSYKISEEMVDLINMLMFILDNEDFSFDISILENYSITAFWETDNGVNQLLTSIENEKDPNDVVNFLKFLNILRIPFIPTGILNPITDFTFDFIINNTEPVLTIEKEIEVVNMNTGLFNMEVTVKNEGNATAWGRDMGGTVFDTSNIQVPAMLELFTQFYYGESANEVLNLDENPKFFLIDLYGTGIYDNFYPSITGPAAFLPYSPDIADLVLENAFTFYAMGFSPLEVQNLANTLSNPQSVMNPNNWYLLPGESFSFTIENASLLSYTTYDPFYIFNYSINENYQPTIIQGNIKDNSKPEDGIILDNNYWNISSIEHLEENQIEIAFSFEENESKPVDLSSKNIDRIQFTSNFITNLTGEDIFSDLELKFYNFSSKIFENVNENTLTVTNTSIQYYVLENMDNYFDPSNGYTSYFKLKIITEEPIKIGINQLNFRFLDRDLNRILHNPAKLSYTNEKSNNNYVIESNSILSVTDNGPILEIRSELGKYNSFPGELNNCTIKINNVGDRVAKNCNVSVEIPGKIYDYDEGVFILEEGKLIYNTASFGVGQSLETNFKFYTPNTIYCPNAIAEYNNPYILINGTADYSIKSNDLFLSAPIDYKSKIGTPFVDQVLIKYYTNYTNANEENGIAPELGDHIKFTISVKSIGETTINELEIILPEKILGYKRLDSESLKITNLQPDITQSISFIVNKTDYNSIMYKGIQLKSLESPILRRNPDYPIILSYARLEVSKSFSDLDGVSGNLVTVTINVTNRGNTAFENITVNDVNGFQKVGFRLASGVLDNKIKLLKPGESYVYSYVLRFNQQGSYIISPTKVTYEYLHVKVAESNTLIVKVRNIWIVNALWILLPMSIALISTFGLYHWKNRYDLEAAQFERREELMFGSDYRSTSWDKFVIEEHLEAISKGEEISKERVREEVF